MSHNFKRTAIAVLFCFATVTAFSAPFHHKFGEMREYHQHWLAVCPDRHVPDSQSHYEKNCWASTFTSENSGNVDRPGPFERLSVSRNRKTGGLGITFVSVSVENIDATKPIQVTFSNGTQLKFLFDQDVTTNGNIINEYKFQNPAHVLDLIERMRAANHMTIDLPTKNGNMKMFFSMVGLTTAMKFTEDFALK